MHKSFAVSAVRKRPSCGFVFRFLQWICVIVVVMDCAVSQTHSTCLDSKPDSNYPLVQVYDRFLSIGTKIYRSTVVLLPLPPSNTFVWRIFYATAVCYYGGSDHPDCTACGGEETQPPLLGFEKMEFEEVTVENQGSSTSKDVILVTYSVSYNVEELKQTPGINSTIIVDTIGSYQELNRQLGRANCELSQSYIMNTTEEKFIFEGNNPCGPNSCLGSYTLCTEHPHDFTGCCKSICKADFCFNSGTCKHDRPDEEPLCFCSSTSPSNYWYIGKKCERYLALWMIVLPIVLCFLAIVVAVIVAWCCYRSKKRARTKELKRQADLAEYANAAYISAENEKSHSTQNSYEEQFDGYDRVTQSSINTESEATNRTLPSIIKPYQNERRESLTSTESVSVVSQSSYDSWSLATEGTVTKEHFEEVIIQEETYEQNRGALFQSYPPTSKSNDISAVKVGIRPGWTPSLGPQTQRYENVPVDLKAFSPDTNI